MAVFHASSKPISRGSGRSATASSAYRAGEEIQDERTGKTYDYTRRNGVLYSEARDKEGKVLNRSELWNKAEQSETRKNARTAREWVVAIPHELIPKDLEAQKDPNQNKGIQAVNNFADKLAEKYNVAVDVAVHAPDKEGDNRNYHAHIMTTTREVSINSDGAIELGKKTNLELSNTKLKQLELPKTQEQIKEIRKDWETIANKELEKAGLKQTIDSRSYADQGKNILPTIKMGWKATEMERQGIKTERGDINRGIIATNIEIEKTAMKIDMMQRKQGIEQFKNSIENEKLGQEMQNEIQPDKKQIGIER